MTGTETSTVSSSTGSASSLPSRTEFHKDDYTHPCHPLYVHPSDILGGSLVSVPFDGTCYASWRRTILVTLSVRNKLEFIDGTSLRPSSDSPLARQWQSELEERYGKADGARIFELKKELAHISQGSLDIPSYFNKIKQLWDEIASISVRRAKICNCGAKGLYQEDEDEQKLYQFLMGLNDTYRTVSAPSHFPSSSTSFNVGVTQQPSYSSRKPGHTIDKCYKLHGFPPGFKFTKNLGSRKTAAHVEVESLSASPLSSEATDGGLYGLTSDQHSQLLLLLKQTHISPTTSSPSCLMASTNFAGPFSEDASGSW
ncbi:hypothetical protein KY284_012816 [Solanum tuberosum]|nr:hypothetical protein KY284_012816 [Solanum tuberosum]